MSNFSKKYRWKLLMTFLAVVCAAGLLVGFVTLPMFFRITSAAEAIGRDRSLIQLLEERRAANLRIGEKLKAMELGVARLEQTFLDAGEGVLPIITMIEQTAKLEKVSLTIQSATENPTQPPGFSVKARYGIAATVGGDFYQVMRFLRRLENSPRRILITTVSINRGTEGSAPLVLQFNLLAF